MISATHNSSAILRLVPPCANSLRTSCSRSVSVTDSVGCANFWATDWLNHMQPCITTRIASDTAAGASSFHVTSHTRLYQSTYMNTSPRTHSTESASGLPCVGDHRSSHLSFKIVSLSLPRSCQMSLDWTTCRKYTYFA